jgi:hypothetical protein
VCRDDAGEVERSPLFDSDQTLSAAVHPYQPFIVGLKYVTKLKLHDVEARESCVVN